jgi:hypothetical protein
VLSSRRLPRMTRSARATSSASSADSSHVPRSALVSPSPPPPSSPWTAAPGGRSMPDHAPDSGVRAYHPSGNANHPATLPKHATSCPPGVSSNTARSQSRYQTVLLLDGGARSASGVIVPSLKPAVTPPHAGTRGVGGDAEELSDVARLTDAKTFGEESGQWRGKAGAMLTPAGHQP